MAQVDLDEHWQVFIQNQVSSGRYHSESDVVEQALRDMEVKHKKIMALRKHLDEGASDTVSGNYSDMDIDNMMELLERKIDGTEG